MRVGQQEFWSRNSLAARIALTSAFFGLVISGGAIVMGFYSLSLQLEERAVDELKGKRELLIHLLSEMPSPEAVLQNKHRLGDLLIGHDDLHLAIVNPENGEIVSSFSDIALQSVSAMNTKSAKPLAIIAWRARSGEQLNAMYGVSPTSNGQSVRFYMSLDRRHDSRLLGDFISTTLIAWPLLLILVALGAWLIARTGLEPLRRFHRLAASIGTQSLSHRVSSSGLPSELNELADEFNGMLERIDEGYRRLKDFSGELAHEMRTPVATLLGRTQVALSQPRTNADLSKVLEGNVEELERLSRLISDMLFIAQADHNETPFNEEVVELIAEAQRVADYLSLVSEERGVTISIDGEAVSVKGDRLLIQRAITNLMSNAIRHAHENSQVSLSISSSGQVAILKVSNQGDGIAPPHLERIFDRFYRIDAARARLDGGTGLGLAIVRSIMLAHGGNVYVQSVVGERTTFFLEFPAKTGVD